MKIPTVLLMTMPLLFKRETIWKIIRLKIYLFPEKIFYYLFILRNIQLDITIWKEAGKYIRTKPDDRINVQKRSKCIFLMLALLVKYIFLTTFYVLYFNGTPILIRSYQ